MKITLTEREYQVAELIAQGLSNKQISERLCISQNTLKTYLNNVYLKSQVSISDAGGQPVMRVRIALKFLNNQYDYKTYKERVTKKEDK